MTSSASRRLQEFFESARVSSGAAPQSCLPHQAIHEVAATSPDAVALTDGGRALSYANLDAEAGRLASHLRALSVGPEILVAICLDRSIDRIVEDAGAAVVIGRAPLIDRITENRAAVSLDRDAAAIAGCPILDDPRDVTPANLAYVIYTSGSTGAPNGVEITHGNLLNLIDWHLDAFGVTAQDRASHAAGLGFDAAIWEVWPYLCAGASVALAPEAVRTSPLLFRDWLVAQHVSIAFAPSVLADSMIAADWPEEAALRLLLTGGSALHARPRRDLPFAVVNNYGPTECTVVATSGIIRPGDASGLPDIGSPIAGTQIHLLDAHGAAVPGHAAGEIHIGGASVGRGYRNRQELTAQRFIPDRFAQKPGALLYRTGDLGRRLLDGKIMFEGRVDSQEQIRGFRVEPEEVAAVLGRHQLVASSVVIGRDDAAGHRQLVAYVVPSRSGEPGGEELRGFLAERLPDHMIPAAFVRLTSLPLTSNGKLDKTQLPEPGVANTLGTTGYRDPETPTEARIAGITADLLGLQRVGPDDNFFLLGGHSLLGTQLLLRLRDAFGVELTLRDVFKAQTVANLAAAVEQLLIARLETMSEDDAQLLLAS
jgi:amino acid adenylation domain-containing protein